MKRILYAIQGTGNGHLARATEIVPILKDLGETDILVSGIKGDIKLPFPVNFQFHGLSFFYNARGGVDRFKTLTELKLVKFFQDVWGLPIKKYDLVLSDFEPVSAWACKLKGKTCIGISHQNAVLHPETPAPREHSSYGRWILKNYAPARINYGFHFNQLDQNHFPPVIRSAMRNAKPENKGHYTVYLPSYSDEEIKKCLSEFSREITWHVFSKNTTKETTDQNIRYSPVSLEKFQKSFITCCGVLCSAGFETPSEAIFMGKKLCVIPIKNQYEQACNAAFLAEMGITVLNDLLKDQHQIESWLESQKTIRIPYPDKTREILTDIIGLPHTLLNSKKKRINP